MFIVSVQIFWVSIRAMLLCAAGIYRKNAVQATRWDPVNQADTASSHKNFPNVRSVLVKEAVIRGRLTGRLWGF